MCRHFQQMGLRDTSLLLNEQIDGEVLSNLSDGDLRELSVPMDIRTKHFKWLNGAVTTSTLTQISLNPLASLDPMKPLAPMKVEHVRVVRPPSSYHVWPMESEPVMASSNVPFKAGHPSRCQREIKFAAVGLHRSGKTTLLKALRCIYSNGFHAEEMTEFTAICGSGNHNPSVKEVLQCYAETIRVSEVSFFVSGSQKYRVREIPESVASLSPFDDVSALFFMVDLSGDKIQDARVLFDDLINGKSLQNTNIVLIFSKHDVLKAKIDAGFDLKTLFSDFKGSHPEEFLRYKFKKLDRRSSGAKLYVHFVTLVDLSNVKSVFNSIIIL